MTAMHDMPSRTVAALLFAALALRGAPANRGRSDPVAVSATLSEWKVELSERTVAAGPVTFTIANVGSIPHGFEVEGEGIEQETAVIQPGASATLTLALKPGTYEVYCPVGEDSHKKLGMDTRLKVVGATRSGASGDGEADMGGFYSSDPMAAPVTVVGTTRFGPTGHGDADMGGFYASQPTDTGPTGHGDGDMGGYYSSQLSDAPASGATVPAIRVTGGGPVIQILPGPFPFPDSAAPILQQFGDEREGLESQVKDGPYSNNVAPISGTFTFTAWDKGAVRDSVDGVAEFATRDGARWKLVLDRVQTKDVPHHPRFGGVVLGLYYHGNTGVHTPLVPTINSAVALWAFGHLYKNGALVTDNAMVHVMLLSRTRRNGDFALSCWNCSKNKIEELQLQILPGPGEPKFDAPGGFLFVNWEKSRSAKPATYGE